MKGSIATFTGETSANPRPPGDGASLRDLPPWLRERPWRSDANEDDPRALASLMLAVISLVIGYFCPLGLICGPFAVVMARSSLDNIKNSTEPLGGRRTALMGYVLGIVVSVLLVLSGLLVFGFFGPFTVDTNIRL